MFDRFARSKLEFDVKFMPALVTINLSSQAGKREGISGPKTNVWHWKLFRYKGSWTRFASSVPEFHPAVKNRQWWENGFSYKISLCWKLLIWNLRQYQTKKVNLLRTHLYDQNSNSKAIMRGNCQNHSGVHTGLSLICSFTNLPCYLWWN